MTSTKKSQASFIKAQNKKACNFPCTGEDGITSCLASQRVYFLRIKELIIKYSLSIIVSLETIIVFLLVIIPAEYLLTEKFLVYKFIDGRVKSRLFVLIFLALFISNYFLKNFRKFGQKYLKILAVAFLVSIMGNKFYSNYYGRLQQYPKIYSISSNWSIQGMPVTIEGKNFGEAWERGNVKAGDIVFEIQSWSPQKIIVVQPVPERFFKGTLTVIKENNYQSQEIPFEIRDPSNLNNI
jgi:hypothetical protein